MLALSFTPFKKALSVSPRCCHTYYASKKLALKLRDLDCVLGVVASQDQATGEPFVSVFVDCKKPLPTHIPHDFDGTRVCLRPVDYSELTGNGEKGEIVSERYSLVVLSR